MTQRSRWLAVLAAAGVVAAAAIALLIANRSSAKAHAADGSSSTASGAPAASSSGDTGPARAAPSLPAGSDAPAATAIATADRPDVTTVDDHGGVTHDHRTNPGDFHRPPPDHIPWNRPVRVTGQFAGDVSRLVAPIAQECATKIPTDARGASPVIQVKVVVSVQGGRLSIDDIDTSFRDVSGDQGAVQDCVRSKAGAITLDASTQPDVDHYAITMPMRIAS